ncbi:hypothetical protein ADL22_00720 [Streptomyces sp. NRRL F-4489]|uniref:DUF4158 domain-containing protein n=1 Tax=Streptomyces sp. NRRL F-4489 TaxID=1609095 RepID=UPI00074A0E2D|nr:DUF4158 domain-containing protein [Streptomyces sp. NRRL F-4489]KUL55449.1 hypothetical protein ADL22_00720 [Streptomyces sp. NRRL F-4489]
MERTAYPRLKQLISAHELRLFFAPSREEAAWAAESTHSEGHQLALLPALKSYQRMGRFPKPEEYPAAGVDFVLRGVELPEGTVLPILADKAAKNHRSLVHRRLDARYEPAEIVRQPLGDEPDAYDPRLDVDFAPSRGGGTAAEGFSQAA